MRNALEHGAAHNVQIHLGFDGDDLVLTIQDDGKGFRPNGNGNSTGMGLRIMRYRAQCIGGFCEVGSNFAKGTIVNCRVPLEAQPAVSSVR
jgi:signal transduction histidine kinase